ncbi:MAG: ferrous iron transport protein A [Candidatus Aminicenantes bacterium]|nr:MAG: ferrous iron transport protein A [Candidatus Aminicenantes bacterium]
MTKLGDLTPGTKGKIVKVEGRDAIHRRLLDMGVVRGTEFEVEKKAPLGDPIEIKIMGYHLSLRKYEAETIIVEEGKEVSNG